MTKKQIGQYIAFTIFVVLILSFGGWLMLNNKKFLNNDIADVVKIDKQISEQAVNGADDIKDKKDDLAKSDTISYPEYRGRPISEFNIGKRLIGLYPQAKLDSLKKQLLEREAWLKENQYNPNTWKEIGLIKNNIDDYVGARDAFEYWRILSPRNSLALHNLAYLYAYNLGEKEIAETYLKEALSFDPDPMYYVLLADIYRYFFKDNPKVEAVILDGLDKNKGEVSLMLYLASFYRDIGNIGPAIEYYEKVYVEEPRENIKEEIAGLKAKL